jgi:hypothetical protein
MERTVVLYHGNCPDGFGGAYAAWKKFGDTAEYVPLSRGDEAPVELVSGAEAYFIDFSYGQATMDRIKSAAKRLVVLDHHEGVEEVVKSMPEHVFASDRSGAGIAWDYFHPDASRPKLIDHVEDDDLFRFSIEDTREIMTYLEVQPFEFGVWDAFARKLDDPAGREAMLATARAFREHFEKLAAYSVEHAKLISFEGYEVYFAATHPIKSMKSLVGHLLARKKGPFALVATAHPEGYGVSIRGDGGIDCTKIAQKYGGNGHPDASGFIVPTGLPMPWTLIKEEA